MWRQRAILLALLVSAGLLGASSCRSRQAEPQRTREAEPRTSEIPGAGAPDALECRARSIGTLLAVPEASGATYVADARSPHVLVVADSGHDGLLARLDPETAAIQRTWHLPLNQGASDDLEGLSMLGDTLVAITSSGWVRHWRALPDGSAWQLVEPAYPIAAPASRDVCASGERINCGRNYEGLCLRRDAEPGPDCAGFAASKRDGALLCVTLDDRGRLAIDSNRVIPVTDREALTGCDFDPEGRILWAGANLFGGNRVARITGWRDPARARIEDLGPMASGFAEAIAVAPGGVIHRFSDLGGDTSLADSYICE